MISADLDALNDSFHGLKDLVAKWVPCNCSRCRRLTEPEFFEQERLLKRKKDGKLKVECPASYEDVDVLELLDGIRVDQLPGWAKDENYTKTNRFLSVRAYLESSNKEVSKEIHSFLFKIRNLFCKFTRRIQFFTF